MPEEDWGHVANCTGEYLHLAKDLPSIENIPHEEDSSNKRKS